MTGGLERRGPSTENTAHVAHSGGGRRSLQANRRPRRVSNTRSDAPNTRTQTRRLRCSRQGASFLASLSDVRQENEIKTKFIPIEIRYNGVCACGRAEL